jgi:hypothetical protein
VATRSRFGQRKQYIYIYSKYPGYHRRGRHPPARKSWTTVDHHRQFRSSGMPIRDDR